MHLVPTRSPPPPALPSTGTRATIAIAIAAVVAAFTLRLAFAHPHYRSDFDQVWAAARFLREGVDPYRAIGPGRAFAWRWPFFYPLPAAVIVLPLSYLPLWWARTLFAGVSSGLLAFGLSRTGFARFPLFASEAFLVSVLLTQWAPLLAATVLLTPLAAVVAVAKPNLGVAVIAGMRSTRAQATALGGAVVLLAVSTIILPGWILEWRDALRSQAFMTAPVARAGGVLLLLALLRWRRPEARLLVALALVPSTPSHYDSVLLFCVAQSMRESLALATLSYAADVIGTTAAAGLAFEPAATIDGQVLVALLYLPALLMVLRRPNVGEVPRWIDRAISGARVALVKQRAAA